MHMVNPAPTFREAEAIRVATTYGDAAGEHRRMKRGRYSAWAWVVLGFLIHVSGWFFVSMAALVLLAGQTARGRGGGFFLGLTGAGAALGIGAAVWTFRDRWRCIEAFCSRFCSGVANLSLFYVPLVAAVYASLRGVDKFRGR
jgi:hypothetical protein